MGLEDGELERGDGVGVRVELEDGELERGLEVGNAVGDGEGVKVGLEDGELERGWEVEVVDGIDEVGGAVIHSQV